MFGAKSCDAYVHIGFFGTIDGNWSSKIFFKHFYFFFPILLYFKYILRINCKQSRGYYTNNWCLLGKHEVDKNEVLIMGVNQVLIFNCEFVPLNLTKHWMVV